MTNPLLAKVRLPGRVFQLPSKALFYEPGVLAPSVKNGEIQVKPMSALAELKMKSADLLISAKVLEEVCQECVPEILKPEQLLAKDVDAIFCFLVASTYGDSKDVKIQHDCPDAKDHGYTVDLGKLISSTKSEVLSRKEMLFTVPLDNGQVVMLRPIRFVDSIAQANFATEIATLQRDGKQVPRELLERMVINDLSSVIETVSDGDVKINDRKMIDEWLTAMPKKLVDQIVKGANVSGDWGINFSVPLTCKDCNQSFTYDLDLNPINFFTG